MLILAVTVLTGISGVLLSKQTTQRVDYQQRVEQITRQIEALSSLQNLAHITLNNLQSVNQRALGIDAQLMSNTLAIQLDSGRVTLNSKDQPELVDAQGCNGKRGKFSEVIPFQKSFASPPTIMLGLSSIDFGFGQDNRLKALITNTTKSDFTLDFYTWCDTKMSLAEINWIAIGN